MQSHPSCAGSLGILFLPLILCLPAVAGDDKPACAILTFDAKGGISREESALLTDRFAIEFDKLKTYTLVNRSKMTDILKLQQFSKMDNCTATECAVEAGQLLGVKYMIYGSLGKIGNMYTVNTYLVNVGTGATEKTATTDTRGSIEDLLTEAMGSNAKELVTGVKGTAKPAPPPAAVQSAPAVSVTPADPSADKEKKKYKRPKVH